MSPTHLASDKKGLGTGTPKDLHVLCYQHHTEMLPKDRAEIEKPLLYACREAGRLVSYDTSGGYFIDTEDPKSLEQEITPKVRCSNDGRLMYLAEVRPERKSFRLWRCPECDASRTDEESLPGSSKKAGA